MKPLTEETTERNKMVTKGTTMSSPTSSHDDVEAEASSKPKGDELSSTKSPKSILDRLNEEVNNSSWGNADFDNIMESYDTQNELAVSKPRSGEKQCTTKDRKKVKHNNTAISSGGSGHRIPNKHRRHRGSKERISESSPERNCSNSSYEEEGIPTTPRSRRPMLFQNFSSPGALCRLRTVFASQQNSTSKNIKNIGSPKMAVESSPPDTQKSGSNMNKFLTRSPGTLRRLRTLRSYHNTKPPQSSSSYPNICNSRAKASKELAPPSRKFASMPNAVSSKPPRDDINRPSRSCRGVTREIFAPPLFASS